MNVLYVSHAGERGGAELLLLNILKHINRDVFKPYVISLQDGPFIEELEEEARSKVTVLCAGRFSQWKDFLRTSRKIYDFIQSKKIDIVHNNGTAAQIYSSLAARISRVPNVYHLHDTVEWSWDKQGLVHFAGAFSPATTRIAVSKYVANQFANSWGRNSGVFIIHNAIPDVPSESDSFNVPSSNGLQVTWCGRIQRWKGAHIFLEAASLVRKTFDRVRFLVVGGSLFGLDPDYQKELEEIVSHRNLSDVVSFVGFQSKVQNILQSSDIVVHSSIRPEPFGLVILDAMRASKPVIASNEGGPVEIVEHGVTGLLIPPKDPEKLAEAMIELLQNESLRKRMGNAGKLRMQEHFSISKMMQSVESLYYRLIQNN